MGRGFRGQGPLQWGHRPWRQHHGPGLGNQGSGRHVGKAVRRSSSPRSPTLTTPSVSACSKLDALATEYNHLLVTQLESQRSYFEGMLVRQRAEAEAEVEAAQAAAGEARAATAAAQAAAQEADRKRRQAESKLVRMALLHLRG